MSIKLFASISIAKAPVRGLKRVFYDAEHSWDSENLPRTAEISINEGGAATSEERDLSQDANECYIGFKKTYDFYSEFFQRNSVNGRGLELDGFVHFGEKYLMPSGTMVFGDRDGVVFNGFTDELDVIAHELTHGVVQYTSELEYEFQSGALNESLADVFGIMVKQWGLDPGNPQEAANANWLIGEGIWATGVNGRALRDMENPGTAYDDEKVGKDEQPAHWKDRKILDRSKDNGGVHYNSGIPNRAFFLAATKIGGFSWEGAGPIWYNALASGKLRTRATFKEFADLTVAHAGEHGDKVKEAWEGVGYPFPEPKDEL